MQDIDIAKELIDYESPITPTNSSETDSRNHGGADGAPGGGSSRRRKSDSGPAASDGPKSDGRPNARGLGKSFADISAGIAGSGQYPAVERIIRQQPERYFGITGFGRSGGQQRSRPYESAPKSSRRRLIADVRPRLPERVSVLEYIVQHDLAGMEKEIGEAKTDAVTRDHELEMRANEKVTAVDNRIDKEVMPMISEIRHKNTIKNVIGIVVLLLSFAANIILLYRHFAINQ